MSRTTKRWLIAAALLTVTGLVTFAAVMTAYHWDFTALGTAEYETNTYIVGEEFNGIAIHSGTADILFDVSEDGTCSAVCYERQDTKYSVDVRDGTLVIDAPEAGAWYEHIGIDFDTPQITVCLPAGEYDSLVIRGSTGDVGIPQGLMFGGSDILLSTGSVNFSAFVLGKLQIQTNTGNIRVENTSAEDLALTVSTGTVTVSDVACKNILSNGDTGDLFLINVRAAEMISAERSTGNVNFENSDAAGICVKTSTGDVTGTLLTEKVFTAETSAGSISVPDTSTGGKCEITTSTGNIVFR